jgi:hypothetical protein
MGMFKVLDASCKLLYSLFSIKIFLPGIFLPLLDFPIFSRCSLENGGLGCPFKAFETAFLPSSDLLNFINLWVFNLWAIYRKLLEFFPKFFGKCFPVIMNKIA